MARVESTGCSDSQLNKYINQAIQEFGKQVHGFRKKDYIPIEAKFITETNFAIRITITGGTNALSETDVCITSTGRYETTGTQVASDLQTALRAAIGGGADLTVSWTNFYFTIDTTESTASTAIEIESPETATYIDATDMLGLSGELDVSSGVFTGDFPEGCTAEADLQSTCLSVLRAKWDDNDLLPAPEYIMARQSTTGTPMYYAVHRDRIRLFPTPQEQGIFYIEYRALPGTLTFYGYQECGLSDLTDNTQTGLSTTTQYYFKVGIDGGTVTEYDITTASDTTYSAVITLMNAEISGAEFSLVDGDLRCTSDSDDYGAAISLAAGTTGTDLFATLTDFSAFESAVSNDADLPDEFPEEYHTAIVYWAARKLLMGVWQYTEANQMYVEFLRMRNNYIVQEGNKTTRVTSRLKQPLGYKVTVNED